MSLLRISDVSAMVRLSRTSIWKLERDGKFPRRVRLAGRSVAWHRDEVVEWISSRERIGPTRVEE